MIPAKAKVEICFTAQIDGNAEPGTIAWNSFGYHYHLHGQSEDSFLEAMPLVVCVKVPSAPTLVKQLVNSSGQPATAEQDSAFSFLIYEGASLEGEYDTAEALQSALDSENRA